MTLAETILNWLRSRTVVTLFFLIAFNGFQAFSGYMSPEIVSIGNVILGSIATYFRINTKTQL